MEIEIHNLKIPGNVPKVAHVLAVARATEGDNK